MNDAPYILLVLALWLMVVPDHWWTAVGNLLRGRRP